MGQIQSLNELLGLLLRRRLMIAAVWVGLSVVAVLWALSRPVAYEATAVIQVESPTVTDDSGAPVPSNAAQRLQAIQQRLTTREAMLAVIDRHSLYTDLPISNDEKVHLLRLALRFQTVDSAAPASFGAPPSVSALLIAAQADTADKAARIANDFAQGVVDASAAGQTSRAREALAFFREEEAQLREAMRALEGRIAAFKQANAAARPGAGDLRGIELTGIESDLRRLDQDLVALTAERDRLAGNGQARETERRQAEAIGRQIETLTAQREALDSRRSALAAELAQMPEVERTLAGFDRDLGQLQGQLDVVTRRIAEAETAQRLEERQQAERFTILERAVSPDLPVTGGRKRLAMLGSVAALMAGVALAFLADLLHPVVRTRTQMQRQLDLQPIVAIPELQDLRPPRGGPAHLRATMAGNRWTLRDVWDEALSWPLPVQLAVAAAVLLLGIAALG